MQTVQEQYGEAMEADALEAECNARRNEIRNGRGPAANKQKQAFETHPNQET